MFMPASDLVIPLLLQVKISIDAKYYLFLFTIPGLMLMQQNA